MKKLLLYSCVSILIVFALPGCATLTNMFNENPVLMNIAINQGVARFIENTDSQKHRAQRVSEVIATTQLYVNANETAPIADVFGVIETQIDYTALSTADRLLIVDLFKLVKAELERLEKTEGRIPDDQHIAINAMLASARTAAAMYMR